MKQARYKIEYRNKIPYSAEIANEILNKHFLIEDGEFFLESKEVIEKKLNEIIKNLDVRTNKAGNNILYSGRVGNSTSSDAINKILENHKGINTLDNTEAIKFIGFDDNGPTNSVLGKLLNKINEDKSIEPGHSINDFFFGARESGVRKPGAFDFISENFAATAKGRVIAMIPNANPGQVFGLTELKALLKNPEVTHINGLEK